MGLAHCYKTNIFTSISQIVEEKSWIWIRIRIQMTPGSTRLVLFMLVVKLVTEINQNLSILSE